MTLRREHFSPTATRRSSRSPDISLSMLSCSVFLLMFLYSIKAVKDKIIIIVIIMIIGEALIYIFLQLGEYDYSHFSTFNFSTMSWNRHVLRVE